MGSTDIDMDNIADIKDIEDIDIQILVILKISIWILVMKMRWCSWGGIHWPVALSASNDSSFATLNALNTSYNIQYLMLHVIPDATCNN